MIYIKVFEHEKYGKVYSNGEEYEIGKEYKIDSVSPILCTKEIFHFHRNLQEINLYCDIYNKNYVFCLVEALSEVVKGVYLSGSNHIKIIRKITEKEFDNLLTLKLNDVRGILDIIDADIIDEKNYNVEKYNTGHFNKGCYRSTEKYPWL